MLDGKFKHLKKAKELLAAGDPDSLRYCCLQLRMAIELIAYERIPLYKDELQVGFEKWQPSKVVDALVDCDPDADKDFKMRLGLEGPDGEPPKQMIMVGSFFAITKQFVEDHFHKLGSYLHAPTIAQIEARKETVPDVEFLKKTIEKIERLCSSTVNSNVNSKVTLTCQACGTVTKRNTDALKRDGRLICRKPACSAVYSVEDIDSETPMFTMVMTPPQKCICGATFSFPVHQLKHGRRCTCSCKRVWMLWQDPWSLVLEKDVESPSATPPEPPSPTPQS